MKAFVVVFCICILVVFSSILWFPLVCGDDIQTGAFEPTFERKQVFEVNYFTSKHLLLVDRLISKLNSIPLSRWRINGVMIQTTIDDRIIYVFKSGRLVIKKLTKAGETVDINMSESQKNSIKSQFNLLKSALSGSKVNQINELKGLLGGE
jgi:hypothetical protein